MKRPRRSCVICRDDRWPRQWQERAHQKELRQAAEAFVEASLNHWNAVASRGWKYDRATHRDDMDAQICLENTIDTLTKGQGISRTRTSGCFSCR